MKMLLAALLLVLPLSAQAQPQNRIPDSQMQSFFGECLKTCDADRSYAYCADMCGCMTHEASRHWDADGLREREQRLLADAGDVEVTDQMRRLASACAARARMTTGAAGVQRPQ